MPCVEGQQLFSLLDSDINIAENCRHICKVNQYCGEIGKVSIGSQPFVRVEEAKGNARDTPDSS